MIGHQQKKRIAENRITLSLLFAIILLGLTALTGWFLHIPVLIQVIPGSVAIQFNTAICFIFLAISAAIHILFPERRAVFGTAGGLVLVIALLTGFEFI